jgi:sugar/nucleoside kinase (ribokinase family)
MANAAASLCVQRMGAGVSMPFIDETSQVAALAEA